MRIIVTALTLFVSILISPAYGAEYECQYYAQNPQVIQVQQGQSLEKEVEIVFTNTGTSSWQNNGGVINLRYIELRPCNSSGQEMEGPLYHSTWINRKRVKSYLAIQGDVAQGQRARFVFKTQINGNALSVGTHHFYFRPYHAAGQWIQSWGNTHITVEVTSSGGSSGSIPIAGIQTVQPTPAQAGQPVLFIGGATNVPLEYRWELNGSFMSNQSSFSQAFSTGNYQVSFKARNQYGWSQPATRALSVLAQPSSPLIPQLVSAQMERTNPQSGRREIANLLLRNTAPVRFYRQINLSGVASGGVVARYEWSYHQNSRITVLGQGANYVLDTSRLPTGSGDLGFRVMNANSVWSPYTKLAMQIEFWPSLGLPVQGNWQRSGNNYFQGDHIGTSAQFAQDFNQASGGASADFGREILASLQGFIEVKSDPCAGKIVDIISEDVTRNVKFRSRYMHLSTVGVKNGERVIQGQSIGLCGNMGSCSTASHLHYVLQRWQNGRWESVLPEPVRLNAQTILQSLDYASPFNSQNKMISDTYLVLPEIWQGQGQRDLLGWGGEKFWAQTVSSGPSTVDAYWDIIIPKSGEWQLLMHNPTSNVHSLQGGSTHNTTNGAVFEITIPSSPGFMTYLIDQGNSPKGELVEITRFTVNANDRVMVRQHNATGEQGKEISFDELVLKFIQAPGGGGSSGGGSSGGSSTSPTPGPSPSPSPSPSSPRNPPSSSGGGSSSGGCQLSVNNNQSGFACWALLVLIVGGSFYHRMKC
jgi:hypothetical protein